MNEPSIPVLVERIANLTERVKDLESDSNTQGRMVIAALVSGILSAILLAANVAVVS